MKARRMWIALVVVGLLAVGVSAVAAQAGNGFGPGSGACLTGEPCPLAEMPMGGMFGPGGPQGQMGGMMNGGMMNGSMMGRGMMGNMMGMTQMQNRMGMGMANCAADETCANMQAQMQAQMGSGFGMGGRWGGANGAPAAGAEAVPLTEDVTAAMTAGWLDEAAAYAAYEQLIAQFGEVTPFVQIQRAEAMHMTAWERQFARFGVELPEAPVAEALPAYATIQEACEAAAAIEEANIGLYDEMLAAFEGYPTLTQVATMLRAASVNAHLPALQACAAS